MNHITSFNIQRLLIILALGFTLTISASESQAPSEKESKSQYDVKKQVTFNISVANKLYSDLFWNNVGKIYSTSHLDALNTVEQAARNATISHKNGLSPLMRTMQKYIPGVNSSNQFFDEHYHAKVVRLITTLAQQEQNQKENIAVLRYAMQHSSINGVNAMLCAMNIEREPTVLLDALELCKTISKSWCIKLRICCGSSQVAHHVLMHTLLTTGADPSLALQARHDHPREYPKCVISECPLDAYLDQAKKLKEAEDALSEKLFLTKPQDSPVPLEQPAQ